MGARQTSGAAKGYHLTIKRSAAGHEARTGGGLAGPVPGPGGRGAKRSGPRGPGDWIESIG